MRELSKKIERSEGWEERGKGGLRVEPFAASAETEERAAREG